MANNDKSTLDKLKQKLADEKKAHAVEKRRLKEETKLQKRIAKGVEVKKHISHGPKHGNKDDDKFHNKLAKHRSTEKHVKGLSGLVHFNNRDTKKAAKRAKKLAKKNQRPTALSSKGTANFFSGKRLGHIIDPAHGKAPKVKKTQPMKTASYFTGKKLGHSIDPGHRKMLTGKSGGGVIKNFATSVTKIGGKIASKTPKLSKKKKRK